jgi:ferredoxin-nitrate reductase
MPKTVRSGGGDLIEVASSRGSVQGRPNVGDIEPGCVFLPFHFGNAEKEAASHAANDLTITAWDP